MPIKKTKKTKSPLSLELVRELDQIFSRIRALPAFEMLGNLPVSHFLSGQAGSLNEGLSALTLKRAADLGAAKVCGLPGISPADANELKVALQNLCGAEAAAQAPAAEVQVASRPRDRVFVSTQAEMRLTALIAQLSGAPFFDSVKSRTLGEFWAKDSARSPFEECISFKQLCDMNMESFLRKKSFTASRVDAIIRSIEECLARQGQKGGEERPGPACPAPASPAAAEVPRQEPLPAERDTAGAPAGWLEGGSGLPTHVVCLLDLAFGELEAACASPRPLWRMLGALPRRIDALELAALLVSEHDLATASVILRRDSEWLAGHALSCREKLAAALSEGAPEVAAHWRGALASPGVPWRELIEPYVTADLSKPFQELILRALLSALGAEPVRGLGATLPDYVSALPESFETIAGLMMSGLPKSDEKLRAEIALMLPRMACEDVLGVIRRVARVSAGDGRWTLL